MIAAVYDWFGNALFGALQRFGPNNWVTLRQLNRYWSYLLAAGVFFLHLFLDALGARSSAILLWLVVIGVYLAIITFARSELPIYNIHTFKAIRIFSNIAFISWLNAISPALQSLIWFLYGIPIAVTAATFYRKRGVFLATGASICGLFLSTNVFDVNQGPPLSSVLVMAASLVIWAIFIYLAALELLPLEQGIRDAAEQASQYTGLEKLVAGAARNVRGLSNASRVLILVIHPQRRDYVFHSAQGFSLRPGKSFSELARRCSVLENGATFQTLNASKQYPTGTIYSSFFDCDPQSILAEPLLDKSGKPIGVLTAAHDDAYAFDRMARAAITDFARQLGGNIEDQIHLKRSMLSEARNVGEIGPFDNVNQDDEIADILVESVAMLLDEPQSLVLHRYDIGQDALIPWRSSYTDVSKLGVTPMKPGQGVAGYAFEIKESIRLNEVASNPWFEETLQDLRVNSLLVVPLFDPHSTYTFGTLSIHSEKQAAFDWRMEQQVTELCTQAAVALRRLSKLTTALSQGERLKRILSIIPHIDFTGNHDQTYKNIVELAAEIFNFRAVVLHLYDPHTHEFELVAHKGVPKEKFVNGQRASADIWHSLVADANKVGNSTYFVRDADLDAADISPDKYHNFQENEYENAWSPNACLFTLLELAEGRCLGRMAFDRPAADVTPSPELFAAIDIFASMAVWALAKSQTDRRRESVLISLSNGLSKSKDWNTVGELTVNAAAQLLEAEGCTLYLIQDDEIVLTHSNYQTANIGNTKRLVAEPGCGLVAWVGCNQRVYKSNHQEYKKHPAWAGETDHLQYLESKACHSLLMVPIISEGHGSIGVICFENKADFSQEFNDDDLRLGHHLGAQIATAYRSILAERAIQHWRRWGIEDDLHELLNWQHLGIVTPLETIMKLYHQGHHDGLEELLQELIRNARSAVTEVKSLHSMALSNYLEIQDLCKALDAMCRAWVRRVVVPNGRYPITIDCPAELKLPPLLRVVMLKIASNAVINSLEHSGLLEDENVSIQINVRHTEKTVTLNVIDNGHGQHPFSQGYGITRMHQLKTQINNSDDNPFYLTLCVGPAGNQGTDVTLQATIRASGEQRLHKQFTN